MCAHVACTHTPHTPCLHRAHANTRCVCVMNARLVVIHPNEHERGVFPDFPAGPSSALCPDSAPAAPLDRHPAPPALLTLAARLPGEARGLCASSALLTHPRRLSGLVALGPEPPSAGTAPAPAPAPAPALAHFSAWALPSLFPLRKRVAKPPLNHRKRGRLLVPRGRGEEARRRRPWNGLQEPAWALRPGGIGGRTCASTAPACTWTQR